MSEVDSKKEDIAMAVETVQMCAETMRSSEQISERAKVRAEKLFKTEYTFLYNEAPEELKLLDVYDIAQQLQLPV